MSNAVNKSSFTESRDDIDRIDEGLSSEIPRRRSTDDFVWIEQAMLEATACEDLLGSSSETDAEIVNIAQHCTSGTKEENLPEYKLEDTENPTEWEKELLIDEQYWKQNGADTHRVTSSRIKYPASHRLTIRQLNNIENFKTVVREPSYFKFDSSTTATLERLIAEKYVGPLHNIVSKGKNSVVIHAECPETGVVRVRFPGGNAVKVYKLTNDVKKNTVLLKRAQREYEHLLLLRGHVPNVVHKRKNVLIYGFAGRNQETAPSITKLQPEHMKDMYQIIINDMDMWYTKCNIVHGNLCTKNIVFVEIRPYSQYDKPYILDIIGWGHSVKRDHPRALIKLMKDCYFVTNFFRGRDVPVKSTEELFKHITGLDKISNKVLDVIYKKGLWQDGHLTNPNRH